MVLNLLAIIGTLWVVFLLIALFLSTLELWIGIAIIGFLLWSVIHVLEWFV